MRVRLILLPLLSLGAALLLFGNPQEIGRVAVQLAVVAAPVAALLFAPEAWAKRKEVALAAGASLVAVLLVGAFGPLLKPLLLPALLNLPVDHRWDVCPLCPHDNGIRVSDPEAPMDGDELRVVVLGDSFAAGELLDDRLDAFPFVLERRLREQHPTVRVYNFGWVSSSPLLQKRQLQELGARYRPDLVLQAVDLTDFADDLKYGDKLQQQGLRRPEDLSVYSVLAVRLGLLLGRADLLGWLKQQLPGGGATDLGDGGRDPAHNDRFWVVSQPPDRAQHLLDATWANVEETAAVAEDLGATFGATLLPRYQLVDRTFCPRDWEAGEFPGVDDHLRTPYVDFASRDGAVPFLNLLPTFAAQTDSFVLPDDPHYNALGHRLTGEALAAFVQQRGLLPR